MKVLITGAQGYVGQALSARLLSAGVLSGRPLTRLILLDHVAAASHNDERVAGITGNITDRDCLAQAVAEVDVVFHLASIPGGAATRDFALGLNVNLQATIQLFEAIRLAARRPRVVFASTIGVYGAPMPEVIDEHTLPDPFMSYGAHKLMGEILLNDYSLRQFFDGVALRLPGIVARPKQPSGLLSAFISNLIRDLSAGESFVCPVAAEGRSWLMSRPCLIDNLLHAAQLSSERLQAQRVYLLPVLHASMAELVEAIAALHGPAVRQRIRYEPDAALQAQFAAYPPLHCPRALAAGFVHDGDLTRLVTRALE